jgi:acetoin:2,6-dichlorophenolindophenol oxidoreductase subunit beta
MHESSRNTPVSVITVNQALDAALREEMRRDSRVLLFGEGAAVRYRDLHREFGISRVRSMQIAGAITGAAVGAAASGLRPVVDLSFAPMLTVSMNALINHAAKLRYMSGGQFEFPLVVLASTGSGCSLGAQHNHSIEAMFVHAPGLKVVMPCNASDAKAMLKAAVRDNNPVVFFTDMALSCVKGDVNDDAYLVPLGKAAVVRKGSDVTLVSYGKSVSECVQAADQLAASGFSAEVIDLRTLKPLDESTILRSVHKTGRLIIVHEANRLCGIGAEVAAIVSEKAFDALNAPIVRLTGPDAPSAASRVLEQAASPQSGTIREAALRLVEQAAAA